MSLQGPHYASPSGECAWQEMSPTLINMTQVAPRSWTQGMVSDHLHTTQGDDCTGSIQIASNAKSFAWTA